MWGEWGKKIVHWHWLREHRVGNAMDVTPAEVVPYLIKLLRAELQRRLDILPVKDETFEAMSNSIGVPSAESDCKASCLGHGGVKMSQLFSSLSTDSDEAASCTPDRITARRHSKSIRTVVDCCSDMTVVQHACCKTELNRTVGCGETESNRTLSCRAEKSIFRTVWLVMVVKVLGSVRICKKTEFIPKRSCMWVGKSEGTMVNEPLIKTMSCELLVEIWDCESQTTVNSGDMEENGAANCRVMRPKVEIIVCCLCHLEVPGTDMLRMDISPCLSQSVVPLLSRMGCVVSISEMHSVCCMPGMVSPKFIYLLGENDTHKQQSFINDDQVNDFSETDSECGIHVLMVTRRHAVHCAFTAPSGTLLHLNLKSSGLEDKRMKRIFEQRARDVCTDIEKMVQVMVVVLKEALDLSVAVIFFLEQPSDLVDHETALQSSLVMHHSDESFGSGSILLIPDGTSADNVSDYNIDSSSRNGIIMTTPPQICPVTDDIKTRSAFSKPEDDVELEHSRSILISKQDSTADCIENSTCSENTNRNVDACINKTEQPGFLEQSSKSATGHLRSEGRSNVQRKLEDQKTYRTTECLIQVSTDSKTKDPAYHMTKEQMKHESVLPYKASSDRKERGDKVNGKENNGDETSDFSWTWSFQPVSPGCSAIVAMVKSPQRVGKDQLSHTVIHTGMENEWNRLRTFSSFMPPAGVFILRLAAAGFFLPDPREGQPQNESSVECAFCGILVAVTMFVHRNPTAVHQEVFPQCGFVLGRSVGNVTIDDIRERNTNLFVDGAWGPSFGISGPPASKHTTGAPWRTQGLRGDVAEDADGTPASTAVHQLPSAPQGRNLPASQRSAEVSDTRDRPQQQGRAPATVPSPVSFPPSASRRTASASSSNLQNPSIPAAAAADGHEASSASQAAPVPLQTATVRQPGEQLRTLESGNSPAPVPATSVSAPASGPAATALTHSDSGGTARQEPPPPPPSSAPGGQSREGGETGGSGRGDGGGDSEERAPERRLVTYEDLGIYTQQPKRPDMVVTTVRLNTFVQWPHGQTHPPDEMAEAGFYYTGHADLVRCFHCKGGLKTWESSDKPWIEHSRWFPRCPFVRLCKGQKYVEAVQKLNNPDTRPTITEEDVEREMRRADEEERQRLLSDAALPSPPQTPDERNDPTMGPLARTAMRIDADVAAGTVTDLAEQLEDENEEMRDSFRCKMCQTNDVNVLFLPCGHLVACAQCAAALRRCAMCRQEVKGSVHVYMDDMRNSRLQAGEDNSASRSEGAAT